MNRSEALVLVAKLAAAYPREWIGEVTEAVYVERLERLSNPAAAMAAVDLAIDSSQRLPSIAALRETYLRLVESDERFRRPALPEPELTDEDREENVRRMRELVGQLSASLPEPPKTDRRPSLQANAVLADGPGKGTHLTLDELKAVIHVALADPDADREELAAALAGVEDRAERRKIIEARRRVAVYELTEKRVAGVTHYRFRDWIPDEDPAAAESG